MDSPASNTECQARIEELSRSNDDLTNLLDSTDVAMVLLDAELCVRTFTRKATDIISLTATDTGRPIKHLTTTLIDTDLANFSSLVLRDLTAYEAQV
ncbi:MAG TPA: chemotaxis protein CheB, partial [Planctomycetes bacterium]|nr:chemotaxis protein CheB [Planctomycetota bacterium]